MAKASGDFNKNNLDCLRLILASVVALFHVSVLSQLPAFASLGRYLNPHFAVKCFFVISGMLVYRSYIRSSSTKSYFEKRLRRIYPAYFTIILAGALALFPLSSLPVWQYFGRGFWKYLGANFLFLNFLAPSLPGVFVENNMSAVNGALWTLKIEVIFYVFVPLLVYWSRRFGTNRTLFTVTALSCLWKYGFLLLDTVHRSTANGGRNIYAELQVQFPAQFIYFCAGIFILLYFDQLKNRFLAVALITASCFFLDHFTKGEVLDVIWISGFVLLFGFWRFFGNFAKYGDFSYGVYIIHWPILQALIAVGVTRQSPIAFLAAAVILIFFASFLLWNLVESRFLAQRSHYRKPVDSGELVKDLAQCK